MKSIGKDIYTQLLVEHNSTTLCEIYKFAFIKQKGKSANEGSKNDLMTFLEAGIKIGRLPSTLHDLKRMIWHII